MAEQVDSLEKRLLTNVPPSIYYIPDFITKEEEEYLIHQVNGAPKPKWTQLLNRRLQNWGGLPHEKGMLPEKLPNWLEVYCKKIGELGVFGGETPNHVLVNEYLPGQGIMPHTDGSLYYPTVSTITLGSHGVLDFYHPLKSDADDTVPSSENGEKSGASSFEERHLASVLLQRRSLILVRDEMYKHYLHGITDSKSDSIGDKIANLDKCENVTLCEHLERGTRISLTIRVVPKVLKTKIFLTKR